MNGYLAEALAKQWAIERVAEAERWNRAREARAHAEATSSSGAVGLSTRVDRRAAARGSAKARVAVVRALRSASAALLSGADRLDGSRALPTGGACAEAAGGVGPSRFGRI